MKRGALAVCTVLTAILTAIYWLVDREDRPTVYIVWAGLILLGFPLAIWMATAAVIPPERRPRRLHVIRDGFRVQRLPEYSHARGPLLLSLGLIVSVVPDLRIWGLAPLGVLLVIALPLTFFPLDLTLTPAGIVVRTPVSRRMHPWGEPFRFSRDLAVDPWFLSATIHWYADHPDQRAAIGTQPGYDRLLAALNMGTIA